MPRPVPTLPRDTMRRRLGAHWPKLALGLAALLMLLSIVIPGIRLNEHYRSEALRQSATPWAASAALLEATRLRGALAGFEAGEVSSANLRHRVEAMARRFDTLDHTEVPASSTSLARLNAEKAALLAERPALDAAVVSLLDGNATARAPLEATLGRIESGLSSITETLQAERQGAALLSFAGLASLQSIFLLSGIGLMASGGMLVALLVAENRRARRSLAQAEAAALRAIEADRTLRVLIDALPVMIAAFDREGRYLFLNRAYEDFTRLEEAEAIGRLPSEMGGDSRQEETVAAVVGDGQGRAQAEVEVPNSLGQPRMLLTSTAPVPDGSGEVGRVVQVAVDITDRSATERRVRHMAEHDMLTDLPNRLLFGRYKREAQRLALQNGTQFAIYCVDLDHFRDVNDTLGHAMGDRLLLAAMIRLRQCLRSDDVLARLSSDEFAVLRPNILVEAEAEGLATQLVEAMARPFHIGGLLLKSGASVGIAIGPAEGATAEMLLQHAEQALGRAKGEGRGRHAVFSVEMAAANAERRALENDLRIAIERDALALAYQPKFAIRDGRSAGCEALLRWQHPRLGTVSPGVFVPLAEESELIWPLTRWVLRQACAQIRTWEAAGTPIRVAVNLSAVHFAAAGAVDMVSDAIRQSGCNPRLLEIEVTEGMFIRNAETALETLQALRSLGVHLALDDFGTGYSAMGYLLRLPFDTVKIDRTFVRALRQGDRRSRHVVDAIIRLAHGLDAEVVAEGVEELGELALLRELGCDVAQGFLLARPMPAAEATLVLTTLAEDKMSHYERLFGT